MVCLDEVLLESEVFVVFVVYLLGCQFVVVWVVYLQYIGCVKGVLFVVLFDIECEDMLLQLYGWWFVVCVVLFFLSMVVISSDDFYGGVECMLQMVQVWGLQVVMVGLCGYLNVDFGLGDWFEGWVLLDEFVRC